MRRSRTEVSLQGHSVILFEHGAIVVRCRSSSTSGQH